MKDGLMPEIFCGECEHYRGTEKVPNPKSTAWMDTNRPKCAVDMSVAKQDYHCSSYRPDETTRVRKRKFDLEMKQLQLLGNRDA